jgi:hypothetical protein
VGARGGSGGGGGGSPPSLAAAAIFAPVLSGTAEGPLILKQLCSSWHLSQLINYSLSAVHQQYNLSGRFSSLDLIWVLRTARTRSR